MVMSQVLYKHLQQSRPGAVIDVLAPPWSAPLLERMPEVRRAVAIPVKHGELGLAKRWRLGRQLRQECYQQAIVLPNSFKSALLPVIAGIPQRTGWRGEMRYGLLNDLRLLDEQALPLMAQRFVHLGLPAGTQPVTRLMPPQLVTDEVAVKHSAEKFELDISLPTLTLCPGAEFGASKRWPPEHFAEVARDYLSQGWQVLLHGSVNDAPVCAAIVDACGTQPRCHNLAGRTTLAEAVDLLSLATAVVSNDSGLMHIAAALQRPLVTIYGSTSPGFTPPLSEQVSLLQADIECAPCFARECPLGHHRCMRDIKPEAVVSKLGALVTVSRGPA